jgi:threonine/homoserine/homoserine lactone efflux protein
MDIVEFSMQVILLSASGVLSPGPLFFANLFYGSKEGVRSGIKIALGHTFVELPLILIISLGLIGFSFIILEDEGLRIIGVIGGVAIIIFSSSHINGIIRKRTIAATMPMANSDKDGTLSLLKKLANKTKGGPLFAGIAFTALNPFFITWWFTVGLKLISDSVYVFGFKEGVFILYSSHIWMDYAWLSFTAYLVFKGRIFLKGRLYNLFLLSISFILIFYGLWLVLENIL